MVARVIDGDTIELENGEKLRYIGINTPESVNPRRKVECFGKESAAFNKNLVEGKRVRWKKIFLREINMVVYSDLFFSRTEHL